MKYEQVGNAVPIGLGKAVGQALREASRTHPNSDRLRRIECFNLDLLSKLCRRPRTIGEPTADAPQGQRRDHLGLARQRASHA